MSKQVISSSMVHVLCACYQKDDMTLKEFNVDIDEPFTPEVLADVREMIKKDIKSDRVIVLSWQRYEREMWYAFR